MISKELSQKLYADLINGKTVNKQSYLIKTNELVENPFYNEVFNNLDEYKALYENRFPCQKLWRVAESGIF